LSKQYFSGLEVVARSPKADAVRFAVYFKSLLIGYIEVTGFQVSAFCITRNKTERVYFEDHPAKRDAFTDLADTKHHLSRGAKAIRKAFEEEYPFFFEGDYVILSGRRYRLITKLLSRYRRKARRLDELESRYRGENWFRRQLLTMLSALDRHH